MIERVFYKAIVCSEPTAMGAIKIRVPDLHGIPHSTNTWLSTEQLPFAYPATQIRGDDFGQNMSPLLGSQVFVAQYNNTSFIYFGSALPNTNVDQTTKVREVFLGQSMEMTAPYVVQQEPYKTTIFKSLKGATIEISDQDLDEYISIIGPQGGYIKISNKSMSYARRGLFTRTDGPYPDDTSIEINDGKDNSIIIEPDGTVSVNCKHFQLNAETTNILSDFKN